MPVPAWSHLQSASGTTATAGTTVAATYGSNVSAATVLLAHVSFFANNNAAATIASVKDGSGNSFAQVAIELLNNSAAKGSATIWALATPAGDVGAKPVITATVNSPGHNGASIVVQEISGIRATADGTAGTAFATGAASITPSAYSSSAAGEYLVALFGDDGGPETATQAGSGYTTDSNSQNTNGSADVVVAYKNSTGGAESGGWTMSGSLVAQGAILVAFPLLPVVPPVRAVQAVKRAAYY